MFLSILLQSPQGSGALQMVFLVAIVVVFYFFMIRPQMRKQKAEQAFRTTLEKGAKIVTIGGVHGRIVEVADKTFLVEVDNNVRLRIEKSAISAEATKALDQSK